MWKYTSPLRNKTKQILHSKTTIIVKCKYKHTLFDVKYELNELTSLPMCGFIAQLVEHRTGIREGHGFESR